LKGIVSINHKILQQRWQQNFIFIMKTVSTKIVWWELHKSNRAKRLKRWCDYHKTWPSDDWENIIWPDGSSFTLFLPLGWVYVWTSPKFAYNPECLVPTVKHGARSVKILHQYLVFCSSCTYSEWSNYCQWLHGHFR
jgi:hypothetical protein